LAPLILAFLLAELIHMKIFAARYFREFDRVAK